MLAKRLALMEPQLFTVLAVVAAVSPILIAMNGYSAMASIPSKIVLVVLMLGWLASLLWLSVRARPAAEPNAKVLLWLAAAVAVVFIANIVLMAIGVSGGPSLFIAFGFYLLFIWRVAGALERAATGDEAVTTQRLVKTFFLLWFSMIGVWLLRKKIVALAEQA